MSKLIVVESPKKAKNISQYCPNDIVLASGGHVRALPTKINAVRPDESFALTWQLVEKTEKNLKSIKDAVQTVDTLVLATDLDREGEAIAWHILEYLKEENALPKGLSVQRVVFNAVTKESVLKALKNHKNINQDLVDAQIARSALDLMAGLGLSSMLWRKVPGSRSAGRVQSAALRIVAERERDIIEFKSQEYWTIHGNFLSQAPEYSLEAQLVQFNKEKLEKFSIVDEAQAQAWVEILKNLSYHISSIEKKAVQRSPYPPFITSSLQQVASSVLGYSPAKTMQLAQKLYEGLKIQGEILGLITYMRTDSLSIIPEFIDQARAYIRQKWGNEYVPTQSKHYKSKKHSQEAHEAIRPTDLKWDPVMIFPMCKDHIEEWKLYDLIWKRTLASQMENATYQQTRVMIENDDHSVAFRSTGSILQFSGFLAAYQDVAQEEEKENNRDRALPSCLREGQVLKSSELSCIQHMTQPPARFSEASLVKELEDLGIGRPSTYARILQVLQDRGYVRKEKKRLIPEELGMLVCAFLKNFFPRYVDYDFTSNLESQLDSISMGDLAWKKLLEEFWGPFSQALDDVKSVSVSNVLERVEDQILDLYVSNRQCPKCKEGRLELRLGKAGPFTGCSFYPDCTYLSGLQQEDSHSQGDLGEHPISGNRIEKKQGPYGGYVLCGDKRVSSDSFCSFETLDLPKALWLLNLPKVLGTHPDGGEIVLNIGRFGPYLHYAGEFFSLKQKGEDLMNVSLESALERLKQKKRKAKLQRSETFSKRVNTVKTSPKLESDSSSEIKKERKKRSVTAKKSVAVLKEVSEQSKTVKKRSKSSLEEVLSSKNKGSTKKNKVISTKKSGDSLENKDNSTEFKEIIGTLDKKKSKIKKSSVSSEPSQMGGDRRGI
ncbi:DNA topoisomerase 1 [Holospora obtusa F1]|uniref:DNA topoisomerase 1 n=1 Tax=Holospora obtusa F1 TaxID=1399147 RepID=W6TE90_HOLOB|nr:type I DNA topoisomerase [Holospora obtusa]ETZ06984.1 DNA topoisomerase 1 [Holospora obtusa F1]